MAIFKPAEIRILAILAILALAGSAMELIDIQGDSLRLDLSIFTSRSEHRYRYDKSSSFASNLVSSDSQLQMLSDVPEVRPADYKIDINHCGLYDIEALPGIGPVLAEKIINYRDSIGGFKNLDEIDSVKGIGPAKFALIKDRIEIK